MNPVAEDILMHYGMPRRSGRYPWGSGDDPYQRTRDFLGRVRELKQKGMTQAQIAEKLGILGEDGKPSSGKLRAQIAWAKDERDMYNIARAKSLRADGKGATEIGKEMGVNESTVRSWLEPDRESRAREAYNTAQFIKKQIKKKGMIDVGSDVGGELGISKEKLNEALYILEKEGYPIYKNRFEQATNAGKWTTQRIVCPPGTPYKDIYQLDKIHPLNEDKYFSNDGGENFDQIVYPKSMDSKRLMIRYADDVGPDGARGIDKDGIVEIRRGVEDLSLDGSRYSQVRILVDDKKYIKGMAVYSDDLPDGVDVMFNTNKTRDVAKMDVLKDIKNDPDNPFGSLLKSQVYYTDKDGNRQLGLINKRADQGDWTEWSDSLPSQFLSKQPMSLIKKQLDAARADKQAEYDAICELTNPTIKKHLLGKFADECDSSAVHLKAAALPGQKYHVIIPINTLTDNEIYAPQYEDGTKLALVRYPHGGLFEIPILKVNNKNKLAEKVIGNDSIDAVGINKNIADRLSGADFDGDTVMCIPTHGKTGVKIANQPPLKDLEGFDPKLEYPEREGMRYMKNPVTKKDATQLEMGKISNLITDMTIRGAEEDELARAVRHSMVVIDAAKHNLDYKRSEVDHNISALKRKYQIKVDENGNETYGGASTIISRAKGEKSVIKKQGSGKIDPETGKVTYKIADDAYYPVRRFNKNTKEWELRTSTGKKVRYNPNDPDAVERYEPVKRVNKDTGEVTFTNKAGDISYRVDYHKQQSTNMADTDDAYTLVSKFRHPKEIAYAEYANSMKSLANQARKTMMATQEMDRDKTASITYAKEVASLDAKLNNALLNAPRERAANRQANAVASAKKKAAEESGEELSKSDLKKEKQRALSAARASVNAISRRDRNIEITDREWEAIQAGAITKTTLRKILNNTDVSVLRQRATPKTNGPALSQAKVNRIKAMSASGKTLKQIADALNVSPSTVNKYLKGSDD